MASCFLQWLQLNSAERLRQLRERRAQGPSSGGGGDLRGCQGRLLEIFHINKPLLLEGCGVLAQVILYQEEYDDESRFLLRDFGFGGSLSSWAQELVGSAGLVVSVSFVLLVVLALTSPLSSTASWMCFGAVRVMIVLTFLSGLFMLQAPQPAKAMPEVSPYTTEEASD